MTRCQSERSLCAVVVALAALVTVSARAEQRVAGDEPPHANAAVVPLLEDLKSEDVELRISAALALRELGPVAWLAVPELVDALADPIVGVRKSAAGALGGIGPSAEPAVPALAKALHDPHRFVRSWAAMALYEIGPGARPATAELVDLMRTDAENLRGRSWAASALPAVHASADVAVPPLIEVLANDSSEEVRSVAVLSLQHYGVEAARLGAASALIDALGDPDWKVRGNAACALPALGDEASWGIALVAAALRDTTPYVRGCAADALAEMGPEARGLAHELEPLFSDEDAHVRKQARRAHQRLMSSD